MADHSSGVIVRPRRKPSAYGRDRLLGIRASTTREWIKEINDGFSYSVLTHFSGSTKFTLQDLADVTRVPARTLSRRKQQQRLKLLRRAAV